MTIKHQYEERFEVLKEVAQEHSVSEVFSLPSAHKADLDTTDEEHSVIVAKEIERLLLSPRPPQNILAILIDEWQHHAQQPFEDYPLEQILLTEFIYKLSHCEPIPLCVCCDLKNIIDKTLINHISEMLHDTKSVNGETKTIKAYIPIGFACLRTLRPCTKPEHQKNLDNSGKSVHTGNKEENFAAMLLKGHEEALQRARLRKEGFSPNEEDTAGNEACTQVDKDSGMKKTKNIAGGFNQTMPFENGVVEDTRHPGIIIKEELFDKLKLNITHTAADIGIGRVYLSKVLGGHYPVTEVIARHVSKLFQEHKDELDTTFTGGQLLVMQDEYDRPNRIERLALIP